MKSSFTERHGWAIDGAAIFIAGLCVGAVAATCFFCVLARYMLPS